MLYPATRLLMSRACWQAALIAHSGQLVLSSRAHGLLHYSWGNEYRLPSLKLLQDRLLLAPNMLVCVHTWPLITVIEKKKISFLQSSIIQH